MQSCSRGKAGLSLWSICWLLARCVSINPGVLGGVLLGFFCLFFNPNTYKETIMACPQIMGHMTVAI